MEININHTNIIHGIYDSNPYSTHNGQVGLFENAIFECEQIEKQMPTSQMEKHLAMLQVGLAYLKDQGPNFTYSSAELEGFLKY